jgi:hypothetical protein
VPNGTAKQKAQRSLPLPGVTIGRFDGSATLERRNVSELLLYAAVVGCEESTLWARLPLGHILLKRLKLFLEPISEHINVICRAIVDTPNEDNRQKDAARPAVPEPEWGGEHGNNSIGVLDEHKSRFLQEVWQREDKLADPSLSVRLAQPGEACGAPGGNLFAATDGDEEMVGELPDGIWERGPHHHLHEAVVVF